MFVEGRVEINVKDRMALALDDHELKPWIQQAFKDMSCYRISDFSREGGRVIQATVALKTDTLPAEEKEMLETNPNPGTLRSFMERMFDGKGTCRCVGEPKLRSN